MVSAILQSTGSGAQELLRTSQKGREEMPEQSGPVSAIPASRLDSATISAQAAHASQNMMSRNFASAGRESSRYVDAARKGLQASEQIHSQQQSAVTSILQTAQVAYQHADSTGEKAQVLGSAERMLIVHREAELGKQAEKTHLEASKEAIAAKAQEALTPTDENGNQVETVFTGSTGDAAPMPEISGSSPAPAPDMVASAPVTATAVASAPVPDPDVATPTAPSTPPIDMTV